MTADTKRQILQRAGEFLREAGVLVAVFAPLESLVSNATLTPREMLVIVVIVVPCLGIGTYLGIGAVMLIPDFLIPVTIVAGMAMVIGLYLKFSLYRETRAAKRIPPSRSNDDGARD